MLNDDDISALLDMKSLMELFHVDATKRGSDVGRATTSNAIAVIDKVVAARSGRYLDSDEIKAMENARLLMWATRHHLAEDSEGARAAIRCIAAADKVLGS